MTSGNRNRKLLFAGVALAALVFFVIRGRDTPIPSVPAVTAQGNIMGTQWMVRYLGVADELNIASFIEEGGLRPVAYELSTYEADSLLTRFNEDETLEAFPLSPKQEEIFQIASTVCTETGGAFDPTVLPLVDLWGFGPSDMGDVPDAATIDAIVAEQIGCDKTTMTRDAEHRAQIRKTGPGVRCDLSGVAKGYTVDMVADALAQAGKVDYMVEIGGEVRTRGVNPAGGPWRIGIQTPDFGSTGIQQVVEMTDRALATSGDYRNFRVEEGKRLSHIIDPRTGFPIEHRLASVSVLHQECAWADAYATALMVLGPEKGFAFAEEHGLDVYMIIHDGEDFTEKTTPGFAAVLVALEAP